MKILRFALSILFCLLFVFFPSNSDRKEWEKLILSPSEKEGEEAFYDYDLSQYLLLGDILNVKAEFEDPAVCTEKEVDATIFQILLREADFAEKNGPAERYNKVRIDFSMMLDGTVMDDFTQPDYEIVIGMETENPMETLLGETLMGARVGETRSVEYEYPDAVLKDELTGKTVMLYAKVKAVYQQTIPELIDDFVQKMEGADLQSVQELREAVKADLLEEKKTAMVQAVWLAIAKQAEVIAYPEKELANYMALYRAHYEALAEHYGVEWDDFLSVYMKLDQAGFEDQMREAAEEKVKNDMIFTQLVRLQGAVLSEEEYREGALRYFEKEEGGFSSFEEFETAYTKEALWQNLLWDKALLSVAERARAQ